MTWLGHSTVLLELGGARLMTDPVLRSRIVHLRRAGPPPLDHGRSTRCWCRTSTTTTSTCRRCACSSRGRAVICPTGADAFLAPGRLLEGRRARARRGPSAGRGARRGDTGGARRQAPPARTGLRALGFVVRAERSAYFAGDTDLFEEMAGLGPVDVALPPVAGYAPSSAPATWTSAPRSRGRGAAPRGAWPSRSTGGRFARSASARGVFQGRGRAVRGLRGRARLRRGRARALPARRSACSPSPSRQPRSSRWTASAPTSGSAGTGRCAGVEDERLASADRRSRRGTRSAPRTRSPPR